MGERIPLTIPTKYLSMVPARFPLAASKLLGRLVLSCLAQNIALVRMQVGDPRPALGHKLLSASHRVLNKKWGLIGSGQRVAEEL